MIKINRPTCPDPVRLQTDYKHAPNKSALIDASYGKCMYCECKITHTSFGDVEHIRPKSKYPHLEFEWTNLGISCQRCNNYKLDKFDEAKPYINPYDEEPKDHLDIVGTFLSARGPRAEITIKDIRLNRVELIERRSENYEKIKKLLEAARYITDENKRKNFIDSIKSLSDNDKELSFFVHSWIDQGQSR